MARSFLLFFLPSILIPILGVKFFNIEDKGVIFFIYLIAINCMTYLCYFVDKFQARHSGTRIPENTLLALVAVGGNVGALLGRQFFRHKTKKRKFIYRFWLTFIIQGSVLLILLLVMKS